jgi:hypothetical protein
MGDDEVAGRHWAPWPGSRRETGRYPGSQAAVEHLDPMMSSIGQQPPQTRCRLRGCGVVRDNQRLLAYADASHRLLENL